MAGLATRSQGFPVGVFLTMTADAGLWSLPIGYVRFVATFAIEADMGALQREVGEPVVEPRLAEACDVRISAKVLGMAPTALAGGRLAHASVVASFSADVFGDVLMACQTKRVLMLAIRDVVTLGAFAFDVGVCLAHGARHNEFSEAGGVGPFAEPHGEEHEKQRSRVIG